VRVLLVVNPTASSTTSRTRTRVEARLGQAHDLEVAETLRRGHATELARDATARGTDVVVVLAGDGTLNEAANGIVGTSTALAALPGGSTNVFVRSIGMARQVDPALTQLLDALAHPPFHRIGVGSGNGRRFLFHLGVGFDAAVIASVERMARRRLWLKRHFAHPTFAAAAAATFLRGYDRRHPSYRVTVPSDHTGYYAIVSNTKPYAFFGPRPLTVTTDAGLDRALALTTFRRLKTGVLVPAVASALARGRRLADDPDIGQAADLDELLFTSTGAPFPWQVDGDAVGTTNRLEVTYEPDALSLVAPGNRATP
jgi:diacylglycerol kinase family enzyme